MDQNNIDKFEKTQAQLKGLHEEISILSKKKPNDGINKFKLKFVNSVLKKANALLDKKYKPFTDFEQFEQENLPTNSDVVTILAQYLKCMETLRCDNIRCTNEYRNTWEWKQASIRAAPPKKLEKR